MVVLVGQRPHMQHSAVPNTVGKATEVSVVIAVHLVDPVQQHFQLDLDSVIGTIAERRKKEEKRKEINIRLVVGEVDVE